MRILLSLALCLAGCRGCPSATTNTTVEPVRFDITQRLLLVAQNRTHTWDGTSWTQLTPATPLPSGVTGGKLAWDPARQRLILHARAGTFAWDGATWTDLRPSLAPLSAPGALVFDDVANRLSMYSGADEWVYLP